MGSILPVARRLPVQHHSRRYPQSRSQEKSAAMLSIELSYMRACVRAWVGGWVVVVVAAATQVKRSIRHVLEN